MLKNILYSLTNNVCILNLQFISLYLSYTYLIYIVRFILGHNPSISHFKMQFFFVYVFTYHFFICFLLIIYLFICIFFIYMFLTTKVFSWGFICGSFSSPKTFWPHYPLWIWVVAFLLSPDPDHCFHISEIH